MDGHNSVSNCIQESLTFSLLLNFANICQIMYHKIQYFSWHEYIMIYFLDLWGLVLAENFKVNLEGAKDVRIQSGEKRRSTERER